jgi:hypothetical protein
VEPFVHRVPLLLLLVALAMPAAAQQGPAVVAVLDSGVDSQHAELQGRVVERRSFVQPSVPIPGLPDPFQLRQDPDGQGTGVASLVAGKTLGHDLRVMDLQVSGRYTGTMLDPAAESAASQAMDWLLASGGARVALLSFANHAPSGPGAASLAAQAKALWDVGVLVVVPAGGNSTLHLSPYVVTVGGMETTGNCALPASTQVLKPDLSAKSRGVTVANPSNPAQPTAPATTQRDGTPYAAAQVANAAARAWTERPDLPVAALAGILRATAMDAAPGGPDACTGYGVLDAESVVKAAREWQDPLPKEPLSRSSPAAFVGVVLVLAALALSRRK